MMSPYAVGSSEYRHAFVSAQRAQLDGLRMLQRFAHFQFTLAEDFLDHNIAGVQALVDAENSFDYLRKQGDICVHFMQKANEHAQELVRDATASLRKFSATTVAAAEDPAEESALTDPNAIPENASPANAASFAASEGPDSTVMQPSAEATLSTSSAAMPEQFPEASAVVESQAELPPEPPGAPVMPATAAEPVELSSPAIPPKSASPRAVVKSSRGPAKKARRRG